MKFIKVKCVACQQPLVVPEDLINEIINCPNCQMSIVVDHPKAIPSLLTTTFLLFKKKYQGVPAWGWLLIIIGVSLQIILGIVNTYEENKSNVKIIEYKDFKEINPCSVSFSIVRSKRLNNYDGPDRFFEVYVLVVNPSIQVNDLKKIANHFYEFNLATTGEVRWVHVFTDKYYAKKFPVLCGPEQIKSSILKYDDDSWVAKGYDKAYVMQYNYNEACSSRNFASIMINGLSGDQYTYHPIEGNKAQLWNEAD